MRLTGNVSQLTALIGKRSAVDQVHNTLKKKQAASGI
jgi:hypothetical protein